MPCRKENYIFLQRSVTVDSQEVDALVSRIGDALQLHNGGSSRGTASRLRGSTGVKTGNASCGHGGTAGGQRRGGCCIRLRGRSLRAGPYNPPGSSEQEWDSFRPPWNRKKSDADDPQQLLQELILSGNLIKEAVRRLQFSPEPLERDLQTELSDRPAG